MKFNLNTMLYWLEKKEEKDYIIKKLNDIGFESYIDNKNNINITTPTNRPNATNLFSILNELSPFIKIKKYNNDNNVGKKNYININIKEKKICPIYKYIIIENINNEITSDETITTALKDNNISTHNFIIDILNYVTLITGNPLHAYDINKIKKNITIERLTNNILFKTINKNEINLKKNIIVIKDAKKILAIPGIIGSYETRIDLKTKNILLECAFFNPNIINIYTKKLNIETIASSIFKKTINKNLLETSLNLVAQLLKNNNQNIIKSDIKTKFYKKYIEKEKIIKIKKIYLKKSLNITINDIQDIIKKLNFEYKETKNLYKIKIPIERYDIQIKENILSEIIKIYGYDNIKNTNTYQKNIKISIKNYKTDENTKKIKNLILSNGYNEVITYSFTNYDIEKTITNEKNLIKILNPLSKNISVMRSTLLQGLIKTFEYNKNRKKNNIKLFEIGNTYTKNNKKFNTYKKLSLINDSNKFINTKNYNDDINFFIQKKLIENIFNHIYKIKNLTFKNISNNTYLDEKYSANIYIKKNKIGELGLLKKTFTEKYSIKDNLYFTEILMPNENNKLIFYKNISKYPTIEKNISLIIKNLNYKTLENFIKKLKIKNLIKIEFINIYNIDKEKKSINLQLIFQSLKTTLKDKNINANINYIKEELKKKFDIELQEC